jgi:Fe-S cluster assembly ATPase SufC
MAAMALGLALNQSSLLLLDEFDSSLDISKLLLVSFILFIFKYI